MFKINQNLGFWNLFNSVNYSLCKHFEPQNRRNFSICNAEKRTYLGFERIKTGPCPWLNPMITIK